MSDAFVVFFPQMRYNCSIAKRETTPVLVTLCAASKSVRKGGFPMTSFDSTSWLRRIPFSRPSDDTLVNVVIDILRATFFLWLVIACIVMTLSVVAGPKPLFALAWWIPQIVISLLVGWDLPRLKRRPIVVLPDPSIQPSIPRSVWMQYPRGEYVYVIQDVSNSKYYKIGRTVDLQGRFMRFEVALPIVIQVVHLIRCVNSIPAETVLHRRFAEKRVVGEWFALADDDIAWLKQIERM